MSHLKMYYKVKPASYPENYGRFTLRKYDGTEQDRKTWFDLCKEGILCDNEVDVEETFGAGRAAVKAAVAGETDKMVCYERQESAEYKCEYKLLPLELAANTEKTVPQEWIINNGTYVSDEFVKYALPLIQGDCKAPLEDGLPRFAKLKKVLVNK